MKCHGAKDRLLHVVRASSRDVRALRVIVIESGSCSLQPGTYIQRDLLDSGGELAQLVQGRAGVHEQPATC